PSSAADPRFGPARNMGSPTHWRGPRAAAPWLGDDQKEMQMELADLRRYVEMGPEREPVDKLNLRCTRCGYDAVRASPPARCPTCEAVEAWIHAPSGQREPVRAEATRSPGL